MGVLAVGEKALATTNRNFIAGWAILKAKFTQRSAVAALP